VDTVKYWFWRYTKGIRIVGLGPLRGNDGLTPRQRKAYAREFDRTFGNPGLPDMSEWNRKFEAKIKPRPRPTREPRLGSPEKPYYDGSVDQ
jgi:hypothetical protein